jgi:hypothetical protein
MEKIITWIKENKIIAAGLAAVFVLPMLGIKLFPQARRKRRKSVAPARKRRNRSIPRSVGRKRYAVRGKKAWQVKGSPAARRHMAQIRRLKRA